MLRKEREVIHEIERRMPSRDTLAMKVGFHSCKLREVVAFVLIAALVWGRSANTPALCFFRR